MVDVYLVVGDGSCGKSATIACLTGVRRRQQDWPIEFGKIKKIELFHVEIRSLQESPENYSPKAFISLIKKSGREHVLVPLRHGRYNKRPSAQSYIDEFENAGWNIAGLAEISEKPMKLHCSNSPLNARVAPQPKTTANMRGNKIRRKWAFS